MTSRIPFFATIFLTVSVLMISAVPTICAQDSYLFDLKMDDRAGELRGTVRVNYVNNSDQALSEIRLRLDMNLHFKDSMEILQVRDGDGEDMKTGYLPLQFSDRLSSDKAQLAVVLSEPLEMGDSRAFEITYSLKCKVALNPDLTMMQDDPYFSYDAWYPKAMSHGKGGWRTDDDRPSDYDLTIELSRDFAVASTGRIVEEREVENDRIRLRLYAEGQRGFAIYGSKNWVIHTQKTGDLELRCLVVEDKADYAPHIMTAVEEAIAFYDAEYGEFPCDHLDIICPVADQGGGAFSACNVMGIFLTSRIKEQYRWLTAHEAAHQYVGCSIAQPRDRIPWITVGLGMVMDRELLLRQGHDDRFHANMVKRYLMAKEQGRNTSLSQSITELTKEGYPWSMQWNLALGHGKAYSVCLLLKDLLGEEDFTGMMRRLIREYGGGLITSSEFLAFCEKESNKDLAWFAADWIDGDVVLNYAVKDVKKTGTGWEVKILQLGSASFPVLVEAKTASGKVLRQRVRRGEKVCNLVFDTEEELVSVTAAPESNYPDIDPSDNGWITGITVPG